MTSSTTIPRTSTTLYYYSTFSIVLFSFFLIFSFQSYRQIITSVTVLAAHANAGGNAVLAANDAILATHDAVLAAHEALFADHDARHAVLAVHDAGDAVLAAYDTKDQDAVLAVHDTVGVASM